MPAAPRDLRPPRRVLRAVVPAAVATALGAAGHVLAGGAAPPGSVALAFLLVLVPAWLLTGRERGWLAIAGAQVVLQQAVHVVLAADLRHDAAGLLPHELMLHAHLLAALLSAAVLRVGERRVWVAARRLSARVAAWWHGLAGGVVPAPVPSSLPVRSSSRPCHPGRLLRHSRVLRGPPAHLA